MGNWAIASDFMKWSAAIGIFSALLALAYSSRVHASEAKRYRNLLRRRGAQFGDMLSIFRMTENLGDFGVWQYSVGSQRQRWSSGMQRLFGLDPKDIMRFGDAETLLLSNGVDLVAMAKASVFSEEPLASKFEVQGLDGKRRFVEMRACQTRDGPGRHPSVFAIFLDVTEQQKRERMLERSRNIAVEEAKRAQEEARLDSLTGLGNRRSVMGELDHMLINQRRCGDALSLVLFDIDHFKRVNDKYGHLAGDAVLRRIARILKEQSRAGDLVGRIGGEEFAWVIANADMPFARVVAERLLRAVALQSAVGTMPPVTISIGHVTAGKDDTGLSLFARADEALYEAKNAGRNTVRMAA